MNFFFFLSSNFSGFVEQTCNHKQHMNWLCKVPSDLQVLKYPSSMVLNARSLIHRISQQVKVLICVLSIMIHFSFIKESNQSIQRHHVEYFLIPEIQCINEYEMYLKTLIHDIGMQLKSSAHCTAIQCIRHNYFTLDHCLLRKHWTLDNIVKNMEKCNEIIDENEHLLNQNSATLRQLF